jgi:mRNA interferase YafQ
MRELRPSTKFNKDIARESQGEYREFVVEAGRLDNVIEALARDEPLSERYRDHPMSNMTGVRNCHVAPDLVLLYGRDDVGVLDLYRLGTHSQLGL